MKPHFPILVRLQDPEPQYRWRLVASIYGLAQALFEGALALGIVLLAGFLRTHWPMFGWLSILVLATMLARLWDRRQFVAAHATAAMSVPDRPVESPETWARRNAMGAFVTAALWGFVDFMVLSQSNDSFLQMFTLMVQAGYIGLACMRSAASPATVLGQALLTLGTTTIGLLLTHEGLLTLIVPLALANLSAVLRSARGLAAQQVAMMESEQRVAAANVQLTRLSATDGLTGLANRRAFDAALQVEWERAARAATEIALIMIDVDVFKLYNDRYGHLQGDDCLRIVATAVAGGLRRPADLAARYGGEEFVVVLPGADRHGALDVAERLCRAVRDMDLPHEVSPLGRVSISLGVACMSPKPGDSPQSLVGVADAALYEAKRSGRNRVCSARDPDRVLRGDALAA